MSDIKLKLAESEFGISDLLAMYKQLLANLIDDISKDGTQDDMDMLRMILSQAVDEIDQAERDDHE